MSQTVKNLSAMQETSVWSLSQEDPLKKGMATHSSILAWRSLWTEEPGGLQSKEFQRAGHDWAANILTSFSSREVVDWKRWTMKSGFSPQFCASLGKSHHFFSTLPYFCGHLLSPDHLQLLPGPAQPLHILQNNPPSCLLQAILLRTVADTTLSANLVFMWILNSCAIFSPFRWNQEQSTSTASRVKLAVFRAHSLSWIPSLNTWKDWSPQRQSKWATSWMLRGSQNATIMWKSKGHPPTDEYLPKVTHCASFQELWRAGEASGLLDLVLLYTVLEKRHTPEVGFSHFPGIPVKMSPLLTNVYLEHHPSIHSTCFICLHSTDHHQNMIYLGFVCLPTS